MGLLCQAEVDKSNRSFLAGDLQFYQLQIYGYGMVGMVYSLHFQTVCFTFNFTREGRRLGWELTNVFGECNAVSDKKFGWGRWSVNFCWSSTAGRSLNSDIEAYYTVDVLIVNRAA